MPPLGHKSSNSIGLDFNDTHNAPTTIDLSEDLPSRMAGYDSDFAHRATSPRGDGSASFASSALPSNQTQHRGHLPRIQTDKGFIPGTPPTPTSEPMTPYSLDSTRDSPAYSDSPYTDSFPLSGSNGLRSYAVAEEPAQQGFIGSTPYWLGMYFCFNLGLTLFNKVVLVSFPFAYVSLIRGQLC